MTQFITAISTLARNAIHLGMVAVLFGCGPIMKSPGHPDLIIDPTFERRRPEIRTIAIEWPTVHLTNRACAVPIASTDASCPLTTPSIDPSGDAPSILQQLTAEAFTSRGFVVKQASEQRMSDGQTEPGRVPAKSACTDALVRIAFDGATFGKSTSSAVIHDMLMGPLENISFTGSAHLQLQLVDGETGLVLWVNSDLEFWAGYLPSFDQKDSLADGRFGYGALDLTP